MNIARSPLSGRNFVNLVYLTPGVNSGLSAAPSSGTRPDDRRQPAVVSANGQTDLINNEMIDGMDNNAYGESNQGFDNQIIAIPPFTWIV